MTIARQESSTHPITKMSCFLMQAGQVKMMPSVMLLCLPLYLARQVEI